MSSESRILLRNYIVLTGIVFLVGCQSAETPPSTQTLKTGVLRISADESFKPFIDQEIAVFESSYPDVDIRVTYKPEAECLRDLGVDSIQMIIATRGFTPAERQYTIDKTAVDPSRGIIAWDAIAVVVNQNATDSVFTVSDIREILAGRFKKKLRPVFDGRQATSTVRFLVDSVMQGDSLRNVAKTASSSTEVLDYVAEHQDGIGFLGVEWIGNPEDTAQLSYLKKLRIAGIVNDTIPNKYFKPLPAEILGLRYPLVRKLIYILKERETGPGHGFAYFLTGERGQLIARRSYLIPAQMEFDVRKAVISQ